MSTYPQSGTDYPRTEILLDGVWTDVSTYVRGPGGSGGISISRGRQDAQGQTSAQSSTFTLDNTDGRFSNRNPASPYYGLLRNAQIRHSAGSVTNLAHLQLPYDDQGAFNEARTADKAVLDIVGDLEIRLDVWPHTWLPDARVSGSLQMVLASKYALTGNQRSWALYVTNSGLLTLTWSPDGTAAARIFATATAQIPRPSGRLSLKVTLDVNNGAAGNDVKFWTASSIDGTYTQLGATVTTAGVTSVFASTADLCVGTGSDNVSIFGGLPLGGKVYEFRLYNGIGGTLVATPKFYTQTPGAVSFSDGLGTPNTWAINNDARITSDRYRFHGELASLPQAWDTTGRDVYVQAQAQGLLRRLGNPGAPLRSPLFRQLIQYSSLVGYWPMEDEAGASSAASSSSTARPASVSGVTFGQDTSGTGGLPGAAQGVQISSTTGQIIAALPSATASGSLTFVVFIRLDTLPVAAATFMNFYTTGTARRIAIGFDATTWRIDFYGADGASVSSSTTAIGTITPVDRWIGFNLLLQDNGANVDWSARWIVPGSAFVGIGPTSYAGTTGRATQVRISAREHAAFENSLVAHLLVANADIGFVSTTVSDAVNAFNGETAADRLDRLCTEESVSIGITGMWDQSAAMGYQGTETLLTLLQQCADTDMGLLGEARDQLALTYRTRGDLEARRDADLSYTSSHLAEVPQVVDDDRDITNDVTVSKTGGSSVRRVITSGSLSTASPPDGAGPYQRSYTALPYRDAQLEDIAGRLAGLGTWDEARIPNLAVELHRSTQLPDSGALFGQVVGLECGDTVALTDLPSPMPPDDVLLIVQGYTETLSRFLWSLVFNVTPAKPLQTGLYDYQSIAGFARYDTSGSTLNTTITSTGTTVILNSTDTDDTWTTTSASYPFDIMIEGEVITLTGVPSGSTSPQTFTGCTRSVNGVVKAHTAGAAASLAEPFFYG